MPREDDDRRGRPKASAAARVPVWLLALSLLAAIAGGGYLLVGGRPPDNSGAPATVVAAVPVDSRQGDESARLRVRVRPASAAAPVNANHAWVVSVADRAGAPVAGCQPEFDALMPEHGHGLPTAPRATRELSPGEHLIEGVRFSMPGYWRLTVVLRGCGPEQRRSFDLHL